MLLCHCLPCPKHESQVLRHPQVLDDSDQRLEVELVGARRARSRHPQCLSKIRTYIDQLTLYPQE